MRWFAAFWSTVVLCVVGIGLSWLGGQEFPIVSPALRPFDFASKALYIVPAVLATYVLVRLILQHVVAYTESAIDASPRENRGEWSRRRSAMGLTAYRWFGNPTGKWLLPFAIVLIVASLLALLVAGPDILQQDGNRFEVLGLILVALYAYTVTMAMLFPDRPMRLRPEPEQPPDPRLNLPGDEKDAESGQVKGGKRSGKGSGPGKTSAKRTEKSARASKPPKDPPGWMFWRKRTSAKPGGGAPPPPGDAEGSATSSGSESGAGGSAAGSPGTP